MKKKIAAFFMAACVASGVTGYSTASTVNHNLSKLNTLNGVLFLCPAIRHKTGLYSSGSITGRSQYTESGNKNLWR